MKKITVSFLLLAMFGVIAIAWLNATSTGQRFRAIHLPKRTAHFRTAPYTHLKIKNKAAAARDFAATRNYNKEYCFLIDMSLPSGSNRFFIYDLQKDSITGSGLVTHGRCNQDWLEGRRYGNNIGCGCTSLGKYRIGQRYNGRFGIAFKLYGLEKTNDKAYARFVVLHAHSCVPENETRDEICQSDGCPTVSPPFLQELSPLIMRSKKPVLLWIFN